MNNDNNGTVTIDELAEMIKMGFDEVHEKMVTKEEFNKAFNGIKGEIGGMKGEIGGMKGEINKIKNEMVTKDFLTEKMADLRGDLNLIIRGEDGKIMKLVDILHGKNVLNTEDVKQLWSMRPFPQTI